MKKLSITDIAKEAGVSTSTVSHVLNKTRYVSPEITERVMKIVEENDYQMNMLAKSLRQQKTNTIGIIIPNLNTGNFIGKELEAIGKIFRKNNLNIIIQASNNDAKLEKEIIIHLLGWNVDGMIIVPSDNEYDYSQIPCPVVLMDREPNLKTVSGFYADNYSISREITEKIINKGHRNIGFLSATARFSPTTSRLKAYKDVLAENNIPIRDELIYCNDKYLENADECTRLLLDNTDATAVIIASSPLTVRTLEYINRRCIKIPSQLAVVTFADYDWVSLCNPPLNGIRQPNQEIGTKAAEQMLNQLKGKTDIVSEYFPCTYISGESL